MASSETRKRSLQLIIDATKAESGSRAYGRSADRAGKSALGAARASDKLQRATDRVGRKALDAARGVALFAAGFASIATAGAAVRTVASFEESMAQVGAVTARGNETLAEAEARFSSLSSAAEKAGATTRFSATEAAEAQLFLARAGFDAREVVDALPSSLSLAAAGALELGTAADIASNAVSQFNLEAKETGRVADVLITTSNRANTSVLQLGEALKFAGPIASKLGVSLEETAAGAGVLGDAGIQATLAGTNLRGILVRLLNPTGQTASAIRDLGLSLEEVNPQRVGLIGAFRALRDAELDAGDAARIFGRLNVSAALQLAANVEKLEELTEANDNAAGAADRQARVVENTLGGAMRRFRAAVEAAAIATGRRGLSGALQESIDTGAGVVRVLFDVATAADAANPAVQALAGGAEALGKGLLILAGAKLIGGLRSMTAALAAATAQSIALENAERQAAATRIFMAQGHNSYNAAVAASVLQVSRLRKVTIALFTVVRAHPVGLLITAIGAAGAAMGLFRTKTKEATRAIDDQENAFTRYQDAVRRFADVRREIDLSQGLGKAGGEVDAARKKLAALEDVYVSFRGALEDGDIADTRRFTGVDLKQLGFTAEELERLGVSLDANNQKTLTGQEVVTLLGDKYRDLELRLGSLIEEMNRVGEGQDANAEGFRAATRSVDEYIGSLQLAALQSGLSERASAKLSATLEYLKVARESNTRATFEDIRAVWAAIDANARLAESADDTKDKLSDALKSHDYRRDVAQGIGRALTDLTLRFDKARDAAKRLYETILTTVFEATVTRRIVDALAPDSSSGKGGGAGGFNIFSFLGGFFSAGKSAFGNVFGASKFPGSRKLDKGGFIQRSLRTLDTPDGPTSIAERAPEAVLRLDRDRRGVMGLRMPPELERIARGGGMQIVQNITVRANDPSSFRHARAHLARVAGDAAHRAAGQFGPA